AYANRHHTSKHATALPLYTEDDARRAMEQLHRLPFDQCVDVVPDVTVTLRPAGHILGAASAELTAGQTTVLFSGD
ncbi:MBL fold metallo-hydrolase, partial [Acinetobacter baumannii]